MPHSIRWEIMYSDKKKRGLEIKCVSILNNALLFKFFANDKETL